MKAAKPKNATTTAPKLGLAGKLAWYSILLCVALLPLAIAVTRGPAGQTNGLTDDVYNVPKLLLLTLLVTVATFGWAIELISGDRILRAGRLLIGLGAFSATVLVSTVFGIEPLSSLFGVSGLSTGAITWLACAWLGLLAGQYLTSTTALRQISWATVGGSTAAATIGLLQVVGLDLIGTPLTDMNAWMVTRGLSTFGNPNYIGLFLIVPVVISVALSLTSERSLLRWLAVSCAVLTAGGLFITLTRAAWIGVAVGLTVLVLMAPGLPGSTRRRAAILAAIGSAIVAVGVFLSGPELLAVRLVSLSQGVDAFSSGRLTMWSDALRTISLRPFFGTGADRLALGAYQAQTEVVSEGVSRYVIQDPHSLPLLLAGSFGIFALLAFSAFAGFVLYRAFGLLRTNSSISEKNVLYGAWVAASAGYLCASLLSVYTISAIFMLFLSLGVVAAPLLKPINTGTAWRVSIAVLAVVMTGVALFGGVQGYRSSRQVALASRGDSQFHLEEAIRIAPWDTRTRSTYLWRKIGAFRPVLIGNDVAQAKDAFATLDTEIRLEIERSPRELLLYRMRIDLYRIAKGYPAYQPEKVAEAIDGALTAFPNDPEFKEWREAAARGTL